MSNEQTLENRALFENITLDERALAFEEWMKTNIEPYRKLMSFYTCAIMEVETKFKVLNEDLSLKYDRNPIESIQSRLKSPDSIMHKMIKQKLKNQLLFML